MMKNILKMSKAGLHAEGRSSKPVILGCGESVRILAAA